MALRTCVHSAFFAHSDEYNRGPDHRRGDWRAAEAEWEPSMARWRPAERHPRDSPPAKYGKSNGKGGKSNTASGRMAGQSGGQPNDSGLCWSCGQPGHRRESCPHHQRSSQPSWDSRSWGTPSGRRGDSPPTDPLAGLSLGNAAPAAVSAFSPSPSAATARTGLDREMPADNPFGRSPLGHPFPPPPTNPPPAESSATQPQGSSAPWPHGLQNPEAQPNRSTAHAAAQSLMAPPPSSASQAPPGLPLLSATPAGDDFSTFGTDDGRASVQREERALTEEELEAQYLEAKAKRAARLLE